MAETLGSLCDKLTIVKLKQWHTINRPRRKSLTAQNKLLQREINEFVRDAVAGLIPMERLTFPANKVYKKQGNAIDAVAGELGEVFSRLAHINCELWHEQEKVYDFERVPDSAKGAVVKKLAILNLQRNQCMEAIDQNLRRYVKKNTRSRSSHAFD